MSFNYKIACASAVSESCEANRSNFFFDGKAMKKENHGTSAPVCGELNSDSEQCVGIFDGSSSSEAAHVAINCLRYFLNQKAEDDTDYIKQLQDFYTASDRVITGLDGEEDKRVSCTVGFIRYNGFYFASAGDCLVYLWRNGELNLLNPPENETRMLGGEGEFAPEPVYGEIFDGDRIVICTTSMKKSLSDDKFRTVLNGNANTGECVDVLCKEAVSSGICDCVSCCVIDIGEQTSEGYWILPGLVYIPEEENNEVLFEGDANTIEISSGKAFGAGLSGLEEDGSADLPPTLPEIELPANEVDEPVDSGIVSVDEIEKNAENKPSPVAIRRSAEEKKKQTIIVCAVIAGVLLLGLIMTFIIKGCAANPVEKTEDSTPEISDSVTEDEPEEDDTTKRKDPEKDSEKDTEKDTDRDDSDDTTERDTTESVSRDTEDTSTREEPDDTTEPPVSDTEEVTSDSTTADTADTADTSDTTEPDDTNEPEDSTTADTSDTSEPVDSDTADTSDTSSDTTDAPSTETSDTDVVIDDIPSTDPASADSN